VDWATVAAAGAFVVGIVAGGIGVIRVTRYVLDYLRDEQGRHHPPGDP
jgi:hypothetical protein